MSKHLVRVSFCASLALCGVAVLSGCSIESENMENVKSETVWQSYSVTYDAGSDQTTSTVRFRFGGFSGTNLRLTGEAQVSDNGTALQESNFLGVFYTATQKGFQPDHTFEWVTPEGKKYRNKTTLSPVDFAPDTPIQLSRSHLLRIGFVGPPAQSDEKVTLMIEQPGNATRPPMELATVGTEAGVSPGDLQGLLDGVARVCWQRVRSQGLQEATSRGGGLSATYKSAVRMVTVVP
jgi:hypothetical protein